MKKICLAFNTRQHAMKSLVIITNSTMAEKAVTLLACSVRKTSDLMAASCVIASEDANREIKAWLTVEDPQIVNDALKTEIEKISDSGVKMLGQINDTITAQRLSGIVKEHEIDIVYFPLDTSLSPDSLEIRYGQHLLQYLPCDVMLLDFGKKMQAIERLVIPMGLASSGHVIKRIIEIGNNELITTPLHITPNFGDDTARIAASELDLQLKEIGLTESHSWITPEVTVADGFHQGVIQTVRPNDVIILSGASIKLPHDLRIQIQRVRPQVAESILIGIFRPIALASKTKIGRLGRRFKNSLPELTLADRVSLFDRIQGGARTSADYVMMIGLSVLIASFGLLADNASVIIGAMLVAPFMAPLIGVGLALAQGNLSLMKRSAIATGTGLIIGLVLSFIIGLIVPLDELPLEMLARGNPNIVDLVIAFASGMAAAYAVSRESVAEAIVGVAIAAALVPPLSCVGIMLANNYISQSEGALMLLVTNLAAIALGAAFVFRRLGVPGTRTEFKSYVKIRRISVALILLIVLLSVPLGFRMAERLEVGQNRPVSFRVSSSVKQVVNDRVNQTEGLDVVLLGRSGSGHSKLIRIVLTSDKPIETSVVDGIKAEVKETLGRDTPVHISVFQSAIIDSTP